jgi:AbrB family looped-hinge helix DNA binding protein
VGFFFGLQPAFNGPPVEPAMYCGWINGLSYGIRSAVSDTAKMDASGRLVLPKKLRERLNLTRGANFRVAAVAGRIELTPVEITSTETLGRKAGIVVLKRTGAKVDAAAGIAAERTAQEERSLRR